MLGLLALPNYSPQPGNPDYLNYNYQAQSSDTHPRRNDVARLDVVLTNRLTGSFRWEHDADLDTTQFGGFPQPGAAVATTPNPGHGYAATLTYTLTPTTVNDFTFGKSYNDSASHYPDPAQVDRSLLPGLPKLFPFTGPQGDNGESNYIPDYSFGSTPVNTDGFLINYRQENDNENDLWSEADNLSHIQGNHSLKAGVYVEYNIKTAPQTNNSTSYRGSWNFAVNSLNAGDTGDGYSNALIGNFNSYAEDSARLLFDLRYWNIEFYLQDNWRVTKRLTLDYGMRFYRQTPFENHACGVSASLRFILQVVVWESLI